MSGAAREGDTIDAAARASPRTINLRSRVERPIRPPYRLMALCIARDKAKLKLGHLYYAPRTGRFGSDHRRASRRAEIGFAVCRGIALFTRTDRHWRPWRRLRIGS
jgi:hypothetical protein